MFVTVHAAQQTDFVKLKAGFFRALPFSFPIVTGTIPEHYSA